MCINRSAVSKRPMAHIHTECKIDVATVITTVHFHISSFGYIVIIIYSTYNVCMLNVDIQT